MELEINAILEGKVTGITKFGAFVALPDGKSGLVHISEIAHSYVSEVKDFLTEGQMVKVKVISVDENGRINLSIKKAVPPPPRPPRPAGAPRPRNFGGEGAPNGGRPYTPRSREGEEGERSRYSSGNNRNSNQNRERTSFAPRIQQPKEPATFEDRLKQFMQESDSRQSDLNRYNDKRSSRRGNGRNRGN